VRYSVVLIPDPEDCGCIVTVPVLPGWLMSPVPSNERKGGKNFMRLPVTLVKGEDGWIVAKCPVLPGCITQGRTREEAIANIKEAIVGCIAVRKEMGWPLTEEMVEVEVAT